MVPIFIRDYCRHGISSSRNRSKHLRPWKCHHRRLRRRYPRLQSLHLQDSACNSFISELAQKIEVVNKGEVRSFLGVRVTRNYPQHAISIGQPGYIDRLLAKYNMTNAKSASTPFEKGTKLTSATKNDTLCNLKMYQVSQSPLCLHKTRYRGYALHSRAACFTMPQINLQLLYCLRMFINRPDYRYHQLFRCAQIPSATRTVPLLTESQTALEISDNPAKYRQAKHIDIGYHAVRHYIHDGKMQVDYIPSAYQPADIFTKALENTKHQRFSRMIGLRNSYKAFENED